MDTNRKKVLFFITKSNFGGAQRYVYDLATHLPIDRYESVVLFGGNNNQDQTPGKLSDMLAEVHLRTITLSTLGRDISFWNDIQSFKKLLSVLRHERPHVLHLNSSKAGGLGALAGRLTNVPRIVFTVHGWPFKEQRPFLWRALAFGASWVTAILSHAVICVSEHDLLSARRMPFVTAKAHRIYNGIDQSVHYGSGDQIRQEFPTHAQITGTIGELTANKNQIALIEEARIDKAMYVAIVGEGELRTILEETIKKYGLTERVKLFGFLPALDALKGFDVFALPSLKEGLPYVLLEAKHAELPIKTSMVGGIPEILEKPLSEFSLERMVQETVACYENTL